MISKEEKALFDDVPEIDVDDLTQEERIALTMITPVVLTVEQKEGWTFYA